MREHESKRNLEGITGAEIIAAIHYLERELGCSDEQEDAVTFRESVIVLIILLVLLLGCAGLVWFYQWIH
jgi:hypothetical protein